MNACSSRSVDLLNVAATCRLTHALGPGPRAAVWVQGCPFDCAGCVAPDWIPDRPARLVAPAELAAGLCSASGITGLTFSGGEPMSQAAGLAELVRCARALRPDQDLSLVCFTGYRLEQLRRTPSNAGVVDLLAQIDVLVDGRYVASRDDNRGLRGSDNQRIHHLTDRLRASGYDFEGRRRTTEIMIAGGEVLTVGMPAHGLLATLDEAKERVRDVPSGRVRRTAGQRPVRVDRISRISRVDRPSLGRTDT
ncbi:reductase radical activating protein [Candidatus Protofrankia californiensis]|uniref:Reductase radical activating protein n=1 Tax=Candidatus Protofrankia californiensis TaxID=1839754 RepID=A0A1C3PGX4_9ACTN|nr:reductase radical activating protein [Candidatus Protofrankia californiensis]